MGDHGKPSAVLEKTEREPVKTAEFKRWSSRVEDFLDAGDADGAVNLLEKVVESFQLSEDADTNLGLAAALNDLGGVYASQGLSLKSDECFTSALLIKQRATRNPTEESPKSWESIGELPLEVSGIGKSIKGAAHSVSSIEDYYKREHIGHSGDSSTAGDREEEDWEAASVELPTVEKPPTSSTKQDLHANNKSNLKQKQRGRGSFTYGGAGAHSKALDVGADHVLVISGFSPKLKTKDLEDLVKPFSKQGGCTLRWIDDTTTLAVFRTPAMARDALTGISDPRFKISVYNETSRAYGLASEKDLQPPTARPASTARVAQRMIAGALNQQGLRQALIAKGRTNLQEVKKQEQERKARLQTRAQLRDEAWGSDDD